MKRAWRAVQMTWRGRVLVGYYDCGYCGAVVSRTGAATHDAWHRGRVEL